MEPKNWFTRGHDIPGGKTNDLEFWHPIVKMGTYVWIPPSAVADICIEELHKARMKQKVSFHIIVLAKLFTPLWLK